MIRNDTNRHSHIRCLWKAIEYLENRRIETYALKRNKLSYNTKVNWLNFCTIFFNLTTNQKRERKTREIITLQQKIFFFCSKFDFNFRF